MKSLLTLLLCSFFYVASIAQTDTIQNPGFEQWGTNPFYDEPIGWTTLNPLASILGSELAFETSEASEVHGGNSAIKLVTTNIPNVGLAPSILTNGSINAATQDVEGGTPFNSRPTSFEGWFRFDPVGVDTGFVAITLTKWDAVNDTRILIGAEEDYIFGTNGSYANKVLEIFYFEPDIPDTVLILIGSGQEFPVEASTLFVDDLSYNYPQGIKTPESISLNVFPNPAVDYLSISAKDGLTFRSATIYNVDGRLIGNVSVQSNSRIDVSSLNTGSYILELLATEGTIVRQVFMKK